MVKKGSTRKLKSKRVLAKTRYKVEKKVRDHRRKMKKDAKKLTKRDRPKKDIGIPNLAPFKEKILREAQNRKEKEAEEKQRQKGDRLKEVMKRRKLGDLQKSAESRDQDFEHKKSRQQQSNDADHSVRDNETSRKAYYKEFKKVLDASDVLIQVLDARDPLGSRCPQLEQAVLAAGINKKMVLLLNKIDLVPRDNVEKWLKHLRNEFPTIAFKASTQLQRNNLSQIKVPFSLTSKDLMQSSRCLGAEALMKLLNNYCRNADIKTAITVGIVGFPNVGKSSIINSLKRSKACNVGALPGVTKTKQEVQLAKHIKLLDSPGVVMAKSNSEVAMVLRNCIKIESLDDPIKTVEAILKRCNKQQLMLHYYISNFSNAADFLPQLARRQGKLKKGGVPNIDKAARAMLMDWNCGRISFYTHPPEQHSLPAHIDAKIISQMSREFDIKSLEQQDAETLGVLPPVRPSKCIMVESPGLTMGVANEAELEEEMDTVGPKQGEDDGSDEDDWEDMDEASEDLKDEVAQEDQELKDVTVSLSSETSSKKSSKASKSAVKAVKSTKKATPGNEQSNQSKKKEYKQMLKKRNRSDKLSTSLSDSLNQAMDFLGNDDQSEDDNYDFGKDFA